MALIIVESPTKARTFNRLLRGENYYVFATLGHIRDLPKNKLSIDYNKQFKPTYEIMSQKKRVITQLKELAKKNDEIILATDLDREGESIAYHAAYLLGYFNEKWPEINQKKDKVNLKRIIFHEITPKSLKDALNKPQALRLDLVKAQQARRILDRIVGYELSPLLWEKMGKNWLSAGRVQTVALRLIVEREKEIEKFKQEKFFNVFGLFVNGEEFKAKLMRQGKEEFTKTFKIQLFAGEYQYSKTTISEKNLQTITKELQTDEYVIADIKQEIAKRYPPPPFTTSLLQQEAFNRFGFTSKMVMKLAQDLYERGLITYHRTDSFSLSTGFVFKAKDYITAQFGAKYALEKPRGFKTRSRSAQEAHEAIRPTKLEKTIPQLAKEKKLSKNHVMIYELIFNRALATQMKEAEIKQIKIIVKGKMEYEFESDFQQVVFDGFLKILNPTFVKNHQKAIEWTMKSKIKLKNLESEEKLTLPPPRYTEATLIKTLEERGIGRPSTYAPIISLLQEKVYIEREGRYFKPTNLGKAISDYLSESFPNVFDVNFTALMEEGLDQIAGKKKDTVTLLKEFYSPFAKTLSERKKDKNKIEVASETSEVCPKDGGALAIRFSRFGKFYACSNYPTCKFVKPFLKIVTGKICPRDKGRIVVRYTKKKKRFFGCENYPKCTYAQFSYTAL